MCSYLFSTGFACHLQDQAWYGVDWNGPLPTEPGGSVVDVVPPEVALDPTIFDELLDEIDPLTECGDYGVQLYVNCVSFMESRIKKYLC